MSNRWEIESLRRSYVDPDGPDGESAIVRRSDTEYIAALEVEIERLRVENGRLRKWLDAQLRPSVSDATIDVVLGKGA